MHVHSVVTVRNCVALLLWHQTPFSPSKQSSILPRHWSPPSPSIQRKTWHHLTIVLSFRNISTLPPFSFLSLLISSPLHLLELSRALRRYYRRHMVQRRARAKRVLDYLVMRPPHSGFKLNFRTAAWTWAKFLLTQKYVINTSQLSHLSERLGLRILLVPPNLYACIICGVTRISSEQNI